MFNIYFKEMKKLFSLIALAGVIAACTPEQIETAFKLAGGKITVEVDVVDVIKGGAYTGDYTVTSNFGTVSGNTITFEAAESQAVPSGNYEITVSGPKLAKDYKATYAVPEVLAGGKAVIKASVFVGEPINGWTVDTDYDEKAVVETEEVFFLANEHYPTYAYSHDGIDNWYYNNSEFLLEGSVEYGFSFYDWSVSNVVNKEYLGFEEIFQNVLDYYNDPQVIDDEYEFVVSAWAMWNVVQTNYRFRVPFTVFAFKDKNGNEKVDADEEFLELGSFDLDEVDTASIEVHELPYPGAPGHAHYEHGHGQDAHGSKANAGGGISYNE